MTDNKNTNDKTKNFSNSANSLEINTRKQTTMEDLNLSMCKIPNFRPPMQENNRFTMPAQEKVNEYQSASVFMKAISDEAMAWKKELPENFKPAIMAFVYGGIQIHVHSMSQVSFHGIRIQGTLNGNPCSLLAHQSTVQMLCFGEEQTEEKKSNPIGFLWDDNSVEV